MWQDSLLYFGRFDRSRSTAIVMPEMEPFDATDNGRCYAHRDVQGTRLGKIDTITVTATDGTSTRYDCVFYADAT